jgi:hypothetical protein
MYGVRGGFTNANNPTANKTNAAKPTQLHFNQRKMRFGHGKAVALAFLPLLLALVGVFFRVVVFAIAGT